jgi:hypothetical protein
MNYNNITIEQFQKLSNCIILNSEQIEDSQVVNTFKLGQDILNIFEGIDHTDSGQWMVDEFNKRLEKYAFLNEPIQSDSWVVKVKVDGKEYKVKQTPDKWNVGQFVSMASLTKRHEDIIDNCHLIIAVMLLDNVETSELMEFADKVRKEVTIDIAYPLAVFFTGVMLMLPPNIAPYLKEVHPTGLVQSGDGMTL